MDDTDPGSRIWTKAVALTAVFLLGGTLGYVVGRPTHEPHAALSPGQVRVPQLGGLTASNARRVLERVGLRLRGVDVAASTDHPQGIVIAQNPAPQAVLGRADPVDVVISSGPGPPAGLTYVFAQSVLIPIDHVGTYRWTAPTVSMDRPPVSFGANTRVIGDADVSPYRIAPAPSGDPHATGMTVSFDVTRFRAPAWFVILRAYARQRG
jgi:PASTA domain